MPWHMYKKPDNMSMEEWERRREVRRRSRMIDAGVDPDKKPDITLSMSYRWGLVVLICFLLFLVLYTALVRHAVGQ